MKVKEDINGYLNLEGEILDGAEEAFNELRYVEAFNLLQGFIEFFMISIYTMNEGKKDKIPKDWSSKIDYLTYIHHKKKYTFKILIEYFEDNHILTEKQNVKIRNFYHLRNRVIHRLMLHSYYPYRMYKITKSECVKGFERGKKIAEMMRILTTTI